MTKRIEADWNTWAFIPTTTLQEAVFLSLDFEPAPQGFNGALVMALAKAGRTDPIGILREFNRRMKIASANVEELAGRSVAYFRDFHVRNAKVSLAKFGTWAEGIGWGLPDKFPRQTDQPIDATNRDDPAPAQTAPEPVEPASDSPVPAKPNWRHLIQAEAREHWLRLRASGCNPSVYSICGDMAKWCADNKIKGDKGQDPKAGTIRNTVLGGGNWTPPHHSVAEAKNYIAQIAQTKVAQTAQ